jgi:hypothetical protein
LQNLGKYEEARQAFNDGLDYSPKNKELNEAHSELFSLMHKKPDSGSIQAQRTAVVFAFRSEILSCRLQRFSNLR